MICAWLKERLPQPEVELWRNGRPSALLLEHARSCPECAQTIEQEACVKALLLAAGETTRTSEAGPQVYAQLVQRVELRAQEKKSDRNRVEWLSARWRWGLAAAGALIVAGLAIALSLRQDGKDQAEPEPAAQAIVQSPAETAKPQPAASIAQAPRVVKPARKKSARRTEPKKEEQQALATAEQQYYPLVMCDPYTCGGDAIEVQMTLPAPPAWAVNPARQRRGVNAQLVVGEDGLVRAIKFVE